MIVLFHETVLLLSTNTFIRHTNDSAENKC